MAGGLNFTDLGSREVPSQMLQPLLALAVDLLGGEMKVDRSGFEGGADNKLMMAIESDLIGHGKRWQSEKHLAQAVIEGRVTEAEKKALGDSVNIVIRSVPRL